MTDVPTPEAVRARELARAFMDDGSPSGPDKWRTVSIEEVEEFALTVTRDAAGLLRPTPDWQPIETAPKDTLVLVALIRDGQVWRVSDAKFNGLGWYTRSGEACHWRTHWTPLPPVAAGLLRPTLDKNSVQCGCEHDRSQHYYGQHDDPMGTQCHAPECRCTKFEAAGDE